MNYYLDMEIVKKEHLTDYTTMLLLENKEENNFLILTLNSTEIGTFRNDNVIKLKKELQEGQVIDLVEGENGWGVNTNLNHRNYYSKDIYLLNDESKILTRRKEK